MLIALDSEGKKVHINNALNGVDYFCPCPSCHAKLVTKRGQHKAHHFAHRPKTKCTDYWNQDMSEWHIFWQSLFPLETQEIYKSNEGCYHRADVLIEENKTVIEFQHSKLSTEEFQERNNFYNSLGYKVIWVFDFATIYENNRIKKIKNNIFKWSFSRTTFSGFDAFKSREKVELYFQIEQKASLNEELKKIIDLKNDGKALNKIQSNYIKEHENDSGKLIRIDKNSSNDFKEFASDGHLYSIDEFVSSLISKTNNKRIILGDLFDNLTLIYSGSRTKYYSGCPDSVTHVCSNNDIEIKPNLLDEIIPCHTCEFGVQTSLDSDASFVCKKRFADTHLPLGTEIESVKENDGGLINEIRYVNNGATITLKLNEYRAGKTILELWHSKYESADYLNIKTKEFVRILENPKSQLSKYRKIYGFVSNRIFMRGNRCEISDYSNPDWVCINNKSIDDE